MITILNQAVVLAAGAAPAGGAGAFWSQMLLMLPIFGIMYFLLIRPQQVKAKEHREMVSRLKAGDRVVTSGGIHGRISGVKDTTVMLTIAEKIEIEVLRSAIGAVLRDAAEDGDRKAR